MPFDREPLVAATLLVHLGELLQPRSFLTLGVAMHRGALLFYKHVHADTNPLGVLQDTGDELPHGFLRLLGSLHPLLARVAPVVHAAMTPVVMVELLAARGGVQAHRGPAGRAAYHATELPPSYQVLPPLLRMRRGDHGSGRLHEITREEGRDRNCHPLSLVPRGKRDLPAVVPPPVCCGFRNLARLLGGAVPPTYPVLPGGVQITSA